MPTSIRCDNPDCRKPLRVNDELAAKPVKCPHCGHVLVPITCPQCFSPVWVRKNRTQGRAQCPNPACATLVEVEVARELSSLLKPSQPEALPRLALWSCLVFLSVVAFGIVWWVYPVRPIVSVESGRGWSRSTAELPNLWVWFGGPWVLLALSVVCFLSAYARRCRSAAVADARFRRWPRVAGLGILVSALAVFAICLPLTKQEQARRHMLAYIYLRQVDVGYRSFMEQKGRPPRTLEEVIPFLSIPRFGVIDPAAGAAEVCLHVGWDQREPPPLGRSYLMARIPLRDGWAVLSVEGGFDIVPGDAVDEQAGTVKLSPQRISLGR